MELMLYIGIFSIIFSGFVTFTFEFSRTIAVSASREDGQRQTMIIGEFVRWKVHHAERVIVPMEGATSTKLELEIVEGLPTKIKEEDIVHLFRFDEYKAPTGVYFYKKEKLFIYFHLNGKKYTATIELL